MPEKTKGSMLKEAIPEEDLLLLLECPMNYLENICNNGMTVPRSLLSYEMAILEPLSRIGLISGEVIEDDDCHAIKYSPTDKGMNVYKTLTSLGFYDALKHVKAKKR